MGKIAGEVESPRRRVGKGALFARRAHALLRDVAPFDVGTVLRLCVGEFEDR